MIYDSVEHYLEKNPYCFDNLAFTSGPFHLIHRGHISLLRAASKYGRLVVAVNGDGFLTRKHGYVGVSLEDRLAIVESVKGVHSVFPYDDGTQSVAGCIRVLKPDLFLKGGDRSSPGAMCPDELAACEEVGCRIVYGVGGFDKPNSSSLIAARVAAGHRSVGL